MAAFTGVEDGMLVCEVCGKRVRLPGGVAKEPHEVQHTCGPVPPTPRKIQRAKASKQSDSKIPGPGTRLKEAFESLGFLPTEGCECNQIRDDMDQLGPEWCRKSIDGLVKRVEQEANRRKLLKGVPFKKWFVRGMILRAVREYEREVEKVRAAAEEAAKAEAAAAKAEAESII